MDYSLREEKPIQLNQKAKETDTLAKKLCPAGTKHKLVHHKQEDFRTERRVSFCDALGCRVGPT